MGHGDAVQTGLVRPGLLEPGSAGLASKLIVPPSCDMGHGGGRAGTADLPPQHFHSYKKSKKSSVQLYITEEAFRPTGIDRNRPGPAAELRGVKKGEGATRDQGGGRPGPMGSPQVHGPQGRAHTHTQTMPERTDARPHGVRGHLLTQQMPPQDEAVFFSMTEYWACTQC